VPIIELGVGSYQHRNRSFGEIRFPIFKVAGWISIDKLPPIDGAPTAGDDDGNGNGGEPALALPKPPEAAPKPAVAKPAKAAARYKI
jgi:hypothetical protein